MITLEQNKTKFIFTDIHGNYLTLLALIDKIAAENSISKQDVIDNMVICGDLIDRGPRSNQIVQFCIENKIPATVGNHELMMVDAGYKVTSHFVKNKTFLNDIWLLHGGKETFLSYVETVENEGECFDIGRFKEHIEWMKTLPLYLEYKDLTNDSRHLVCSHSQIHNVWKHRHTDKEFRKLQIEIEEKYYNMPLKDRLKWKKTQEYRDLSAQLNTLKVSAERFESDICWGRPSQVKDCGSIYNVHGHTPQQHGARVKKIYANIDTGCFYDRDRGYYMLTCLQFPEMKLTTHRNIDNE